MPEIFGTDAYSPPQIAERIEEVGVKKARLPLLPMAALGMLAGGFIGLGALFFTVVAGDPQLSFAWSRLLGGLVFSLGLILVVIAGAELFTGNNLMVMAWVHRRVSTRLLLRNFAVVYVANFVGASGIAYLVFESRIWELGEIRTAVVKIAVAKAAMPFWVALVRGVLCNLLVCLAVWLAMAGRSVTDKILAIVFPISAFVACGLEHCVANMYFIPLGTLLDQGNPALGWSGLASNLVPVTIGNLIGGAGLVGLVYYVIYVRQPRTAARE